MKKAFVVNRNGYDLALYAGWLNQAHRESLKRITTTLLQAPSDENGQLASCHAELETERGTFSGIGDASPQNVGRMIAVHTVRLSETRARGRALRDAMNAGVTAPEEQSDLEETDGPAVAHASQPARPSCQLASVPPPEYGQRGFHRVPSGCLRAPGDGQRGFHPVLRAPGATGPATPQQLDRLMKLQTTLGRPKEVPDGLSFEQAAHEVAESVRQFNAQARSRQGESQPVPTRHQGRKAGGAEL